MKWINFTHLVDQLVSGFLIQVLDFLFHQGVYIGLLLGFGVGLWIGVGAKVYLPPVTPAPMSTSGCSAATPATNSSISNMTANTTR